MVPICGGARSATPHSWADIRAFVPGTHGAPPVAAPSLLRSARSDVGWAANADTDGKHRGSCHYHFTTIHASDPPLSDAAGWSAGSSSALARRAGRRSSITLACGGLVGGYPSRGMRRAGRRRIHHPACGGLVGGVSITLACGGLVGGRIHRTAIAADWSAVVHARDVGRTGPPGRPSTRKRTGDCAAGDQSD